MEKKEKEKNEEYAFQEAPASWTVRYYKEGFSCMLTLRGNSGGEVLRRAEVALQYLTEQGCVPDVSWNSKGEETKEAKEAAPRCPTHGTLMKQSRSGGWFCPHKVADDDGTGKPVYCKQRIEKGEMR